MLLTQQGWSSNDGSGFPFFSWQPSTLFPVAQNPKLMVLRMHLPHSKHMSLKKSLEHLLPEDMLPEHLHRRITHAILWAVWSQSGIIVQAADCDFLRVAFRFTWTFSTIRVRWLWFFIRFCSSLFRGL
jgi:hypothetical protein